MLTVTPAAAERLRADLLEWADPGEGLRITVHTVKNLPRPQFHMDINGRRKEGDHVVAGDGFEVYVDDESMRAMGDVTLDLGPIIGGEEGELGYHFRRG